MSAVRKPSAIPSEEPVRIGRKPDLSDTASIGSYLEECRKAVKKSVDDVSEETRIRVQYIHAIDRGDFLQLPGEVYTKAYLRSYARYVGADGDHIIQQYNEVIIGLKQDNDSSAKKEHAIPEREASVPKKGVVWGALSVAVLVLLGWIIWQQQQGPARDSLSVAYEQAVTSAEDIYSLVIVAVEDSSVAITEDGETTSHILKAGETILIENASGVEVQPVEGAKLEIYVGETLVPDLTVFEQGENGFQIVPEKVLSAQTSD
ncbi:MAG: helix-turn-helix domain-containing protein [Hyphomicrobiales bacterium]|nr:helix-turn-helix domain-containing protein [Rickettsiales bacterium]MCP5362251.1 helix-turn-helix domain-containing protein [Hyphomicrobiales bacterium]